MKKKRKVKSVHEESEVHILEFIRHFSLKLQLYEIIVGTWHMATSLFFRKYDKSFTISQGTSYTNLQL